MMKSTALKRLMTEYRGKAYVDTFTHSVELTLNAPEGITAGPVSEDNFFEWEALISSVFLLIESNDELI